MDFKYIYIYLYIRSLPICTLFDLVKNALEPS